MKITQASIQTLAILGAATATNAASLRGSKAESVRHHSQSGVGRKNHTTSERKGAGVLKPSCSQCHTDSKNPIGGDCLYLNRMMLGKDSLFFGNALENASKYIKEPKMSFPGVDRPKERADLIAYLKASSS